MLEKERQGNILPWKLFSYVIERIELDWLYIFYADKPEFG